MRGRTHSDAVGRRLRHALAQCATHPFVCFSRSAGCCSMSWTTLRLSPSWRIAARSGRCDLVAHLPRYDVSREPSRRLECGAKAPMCFSLMAKPRSKIAPSASARFSPIQQPLVQDLGVKPRATRRVGDVARRIRAAWPVALLDTQKRMGSVRIAARTSRDGAGGRS